MTRAELWVLFTDARHRGRCLLHSHTRGEIIKKHFRFVSLDLAVLDGGVIQERVQLDSLVRRSAVLVLRHTHTQTQVRKQGGSWVHSGGGGGQNDVLVQ